MESEHEKYSKEDVDPKDVKWIKWKESVDRSVAKKQRMKRPPSPDNSHIRAFSNQREDPLLPMNFEWSRQKQLYCPPDLLRRTIVNPSEPTLDHEFGYVFCHRALYDRAKGIIDNSAAAIENGVNHGYYLDELDSFVFDRLDKTIVAHEKGAFRVSAEDKQWKDMTVFEILKMFLVDRKVDLSQSDFTESFEKTDQTVPDLLSTFWKELLHPTGVTLQIDVRDDDFKKIFPYYSYHIFQGTHHRKSLGFHLFRSTMFKGYNHHYKSFDALRKAIEQECITVYSRNYFKTEHLHQFPPLLMVIAPEAVMELLKEEYPSNPLPQKGVPFDFSNAPSYEQIYVLAMGHISSFVNIGKNHYNFILEVGYSGLGLGYNVKNGKAWNPLNGEQIVTEEVIFDARFDRALIEVTLALKRDYKELLIASCTRLPDVILPTGNYTATYVTSRMGPWETGEKGISSRLRAIHGGLYPRSDICIADNAGGEIAARTWIDQYAELNREVLLNCDGEHSYHDWLKSSPKTGLVEAMGIINGDFLANRVAEAAPVAPEQDISTATPIFPDEAYSSLNMYEKVLGSIEVWGEIANSLNDDGEDSSREIRARPGSTQDFDPRVAITDPMGRMRICEVGPNDKRRILHVGDKDFVFDNVQSAIRASNSLYVYYTVDAGYHRHINDYGETAPAGAYPVHGYKVIKQLIENGADVNALTGIYGTPLALACVKGDYTAVKFLLNNGAKTGVKGPYGYPLELASAKGHVEVVSLLLEQTNPHASFYATAFQKACLEGQLDVVKVFVKKHGLFGVSLEGACARGHENIVLYLLSKGAAAKRRITSPGLYMACMYGHKRIVRLLLSSKVNCHVEELGDIQGIGSAGNQVSGRGRQLGRQMMRSTQHRGNAHWAAPTTGRQLRTALAAACAEGHQTIVHLLLQRGAAINFIPRGGASPLYWASVGGHLSIVRLLLEQGALVDNHRTKDTSAIYGAEKGDHSEVIQLLRDNNAEFKNRGSVLGTRNRPSPSHGASYSSSYQVRMAEEARNPKNPKSKGNYHPWGLDEDLPAPDQDCGCPLCLLNRLSGNDCYYDEESDNEEDDNGKKEHEDDKGDEIARKEYDNDNKEVDDDNEERSKLQQPEITTQTNLAPGYVTHSTEAMDHQVITQPTSPRMGTDFNSIELNDARESSRNLPDPEYHQGYQSYPQLNQYNEPETRGSDENLRKYRHQQQEREQEREQYLLSSARSQQQPNPNTSWQDNQYNNTPQMTYHNQQEANSRSARQDIVRHSDENRERSRAGYIAVGAAGGVAAGGVAVAATSGDWGGSDGHEGRQCGCCDDGNGCCRGGDGCMPNCCGDETSDDGETSWCTIM